MFLALMLMISGVPSRLEPVESTVPEAGLLRLRLAASRDAVPAEADGLVATGAGGTWTRARLGAGDEWEIALPPRDPRPGTPGDTFRMETLRVGFRVHGAKHEQVVTVRVAREPSSAVPPGAIAKVVAYNPSSDHVTGRHITTLLPRGIGPADAMCVRDAGSSVLPALLEPSAEGIRLHALVDIPPDYARCLYVCRGREQAAVTDLACTAARLGSGTGVLTVATGHLSLTLSEAAGGCVTHLRSRATGRDYGAKGMGAAYGPLAAFGGDGRVHQRGGRGTIAIEAGGAGQVLLRVRVEWNPGMLRAVQRYTFVAGQPWFLLESRVVGDPGRDATEVTVLDFRLARASLAEDDSHAACSAAETVTLAGPDAAPAEAWTLGILESGALSDTRVGSWTAGYGEADVHADARGWPGSAWARSVVALHGGGSMAGRALVEALAEPDLVTVRRLR